MAKDDYYVIAYRILAYLYACLKEGESPNIEYIQHDSKAINISENYWEYIIRNLYKEGYLEGMDLIPILGKGKVIQLTEDIMITPKGIEFLNNNSSMSKARDFLKTLKETIPGL